MDSQNSLTPPLCARGCGFFGSAENCNLCSKCYKNYLKEELAKSAKTPSAPNPSTPIVDPATETATAATAASCSAVKNRCQSCNKKVGLTGFQCRCGMVFCGVHRFPKEHSCTFDFKTLDRQILVKANPVVKADKLDSRI